MIITCDIHCHSGYSGGVGKISFDRLYENLEMKGINIYGSADVLQPDWRKKLKDSLIEKEDGLFVLKNASNTNHDLLPRIILETEIVVTAPYYFDLKKRKVVHLLILFPSFNLVEEFVKIFEKNDVKLNIGRPFIKFDSLEYLEEFFINLSDKYNEVEFIPAHIFTPDGILGGENPIDSMDQFFGSFVDKINALESGLSADPDMILNIEQLNRYLVISNSDAHSESLNRLGREFFALEVDDLSYQGIINSIRSKKLAYSVEFKPQHGRYYLTGHRADRHSNNMEIYFDSKNVPENLICPICNKKMLEGVEYRVNKLLSKNNNNSKKTLRNQKFYYSIPLIEVISISTGFSLTSKKVEEVYRKILEKVGFESNLFMFGENQAINLIDSIEIDKKIKDALIAIRKDKFVFDPAGFDGNYGKMKIDNL